MPWEIRKALHYRDVSLGQKSLCVILEFVLSLPGRSTCTSINAVQTHSTYLACGVVATTQVQASDENIMFG